MKPRAALLLLTGLVVGAAEACGQPQEEIRRTMSDPRITEIRLATSWNDATGEVQPWRGSDVGWIRREMDPIRRERRALRLRMRQEERLTAERGGAATKGQNLEITTSGIRFTVGNNDPEAPNPHAEMAVDARVIRYPLPQNAGVHGRQTLQQKALERLRKRK